MFICIFLVGIGFRLKCQIYILIKTICYTLQLKHRFKVVYLDNKSIDLSGQLLKPLIRLRVFLHMVGAATYRGTVHGAFQAHTCIGRACGTWPSVNKTTNCQAGVLEIKVYKHSL